LCLIPRTCSYQTAAHGRCAPVAPHMRQLLRNFPNGSVNLFDRDLRYLLAEGKGLEQVGLSPEMLVGKTIHELFPKESADFVVPYYKRAFGGQAVEFERLFTGLVFAAFVLLKRLVGAWKKRSRKAIGRGRQPRRRLLPTRLDLHGRVRSQVRGEVALECRERFRIGGREPEADVTIGANKDHAALRDTGAGRIYVGIVGDPYKPGPAPVQARERSGISDGAENEHVVRGPAEERPVGVALPGMRLRGFGPAYSVVGDEGTLCIVEVDHGARVAQKRGRDWVRCRGWRLAALPDGVDDAHDPDVYVVRDIEDVAVRDRTLYCVVVE
jgi:PAS domain-containing protein